MTGVHADFGGVVVQLPVPAKAEPDWVGWRYNSDIDGGPAAVDVIWHRRRDTGSPIGVCGIIIPRRDQTTLFKWSYDELYPERQFPLGAACEGCR